MSPAFEGMISINNVIEDIGLQIVHTNVQQSRI